MKNVLFAAFILCTPIANAQTFGSYECTQDCSGHIAGYKWAASHGLTEDYQCTGRSQSFIEGCLEYVREH